MISVSEAEKLIFDNIPLTDAVQCPIEELNGDVLREELVADRDLPPFHRVAMDGVAISHQTWQAGQTVFALEGLQKAGTPPQRLTDTKKTYQVMTGAVLPEGTDCVIRVEDISIKDHQVTLIEGLSPKYMQHVHQKGTDHKQGALLLSPPQPMWAPQCAVAASIGKAQVQVSKKPKIAIISTGDELVDVNQKPESYQIRKSNSYALLSGLKHFHFDQVTLFHLQDDKKVIFDKLRQLLDQFDLLILSGGVSMGEFDFIPEVLTDLKVKKIFHKIRQRPGKPMWFGKKTSQKKTKLVFGLPGNPVSSVICLYRYVIPALQASLGIQPLPEPIQAFLTEEVGFGKQLTYFLPVKIKTDHQGLPHATPVLGNGSGDFSSLAHSDGFLELPEYQEIFQAGDAFPLFQWRC